jgi:hypothetical protein
MARPTRRASLLLAAGLTAGVAAACGSSGPSDREQIGAIVKDEGTHPATLCHHLTDSLLVRFGGLGNCLSRAASASRDPSTRAAQVTVRGNSATAVVIDSTGSRSITLVKQKGSWLISAVR